MVVCSWRLTVSGRRLVDGGRWTGVDGRRSAVGGWQSAVSRRQWVVGDRQSAAGSLHSVVGNFRISRFNQMYSVHPVHGFKGGTVRLTDTGWMAENRTI